MGKNFLGFHWKNRRGGPNHKAPLRTFSMFLCTPRKTNTTGWNTNHFKTYLLFYMVIFHCHVFFFWGGVPKLSELSNFIIYAWWTMQNDVKTLAHPGKTLTHEVIFSFEGHMLWLWFLLNIEGHKLWWYLMAVMHSDLRSSALLVCDADLELCTSWTIGSISSVITWFYMRKTCETWKKQKKYKNKLVGGFNPFENY